MVCLVIFGALGVGAIYGLGALGLLTSDAVGGVVGLGIGCICIIASALAMERVLR